MFETVDKHFEMLEGFKLSHFGDSFIAKEGLATAYGGEVVRNFSDSYREIKGWFQGIDSKKRDINELCAETIEWLKNEDRSHPRLDLDMGKFFTWLKTSETFHWRFYFILNDSIYNNIVKQIKDKGITELEGLTDFDITKRKNVTRMLDSVRNIKDLIVIIEKYRSRCNVIFDGLLKRDRRIQSFPFQVMLLGYNDLNRSVKRIVNLAI